MKYLKDSHDIVEGFSKRLEGKTAETLEFIKVSGDIELDQLKIHVDYLKKIDSYFESTYILEVKKKSIAYSTEFGFDNLLKIFDEFKGRVSFKLLIDKEKLIDKWFTGLKNRFNVHLIYNAKFLKSILEKSFLEIENELFGKKRQKTILLVCDKDICLQNSYLYVLGNETEINDVSNISEAVPENCMKDIERRDIECNYAKSTDWLTPTMFYFDISESNDVWRILSYKLVGLCLAFIGNETTEKTDSMLITIRGYKKVSIDYSLSLMDDFEITPQRVKSMHQLYEWVYSPGSIVDKLGMLRNLLSLYLGENQNENLETFGKISADLLESSKSNYQIYLKDNVRLYLSERKKIENTITQDVDNIKAKAENILNKLSTSLFGAVAVGIGFLVSYVIKPNMNPAIAKYGFGLYAAVVFVTGVINLVFSRHSFQNIKNCLEKTLVSYKDVFSENDLKRIVQNRPEEGYKFFSRYWLLSLLLYLVLIMVLILGVINSQVLVNILYVPAQ